MHTLVVSNNFIVSICASINFSKALFHTFLVESLIKPWKALVSFDMNRPSVDFEHNLHLLIEKGFDPLNSSSLKQFLLVFFHIWNIKETKQGKQGKKGNQWKLFTLRSAHVGPSASTWALIPYVKYPLNLNANMSKKKGKTNYLLFSMLLQNESITYLKG